VTSTAPASLRANRAPVDEDAVTNAESIESDGHPLRILLPVHLEAVRGVGTLVRGLRTALPAALGDDDELILAGGELPRFARSAYEQLVLPVKARGVDLVHLCDHRPLVLSRAPFVITVHDLFFLDRPEWYPRTLVAYKRAMLWAALAKGPRFVVCDSAYTRDRLLAHAPRLRPRVEVIHPGLFPPPPVVDAEHGDYFLTVSAIDPRKNHLGLLDAFERARRAGLELTWKVVGGAADLSGPIVRRLQAADGVELLGQVDAAELERLYAGACFFALATHGEGFGFPPLEAMARGVPVICSTGSSLDETVGGAAIRLPPDDTDAWAAALTDLVGDEVMRARLSEAGRARAAAFSLAESARRYVDVYRAASPKRG
jgi:glycosyltransferase involved in cell wall biosynthesis